MNHSLHHYFDVIVVGGGHAGIEAAYAAAKMGSKTALITLDIKKIGLMPCNPAIGGVGKGHIVHEIAALDGLMPKLCTKTYLQARMLNTKKGPAVQGLRLQIDKFAYKKLAQKMLAETDNITLIAGAVVDILLDAAQTVCGIQTKRGQKIIAPTVVLTTGTFLNGTIHVGDKNWSGGRAQEKAVTGLSRFLSSAGLQLGRLKTGTPPRLKKSTVDFEKMEKQEAATLNYLFEFHPHTTNNTHACYITHTNERTHEIIRKNVHLSAMYSGNISGIGPRYCPSIEDKVLRFAHKKSHHIFVEPEGADADEIYPNGISTSLPAAIQQQYIHSIVGFEKAVITKPGYAVEYDYVLPQQLKESLEVTSIKGLFLAGQINGTTGYEEAASQGLIAGINAHLKQAGKQAFILQRSESYIGVMINDLITLGTNEPYRMFTSRAERRLLLRQDNAFLRLTHKGYNLGLVSETLHKAFMQEKEMLEKTRQQLRQSYTPSALLKLFDQETDYQKLLRSLIDLPLSERNIRTISAEILYAPYIERETKEINKMEKFSKLNIPRTFKYSTLPGLSLELQEKLSIHQPKTIAQASLIPGMTPAALSLLIFKTRSTSKQ